MSALFGLFPTRIVLDAFLELPFLMEIALAWAITLPISFAYVAIGEAAATGEVRRLPSEPRAAAMSSSKWRGRSTVAAVPDRRSEVIG